MANASRDQNNVPTLLGVSSADGTTPVPLYADPTTHRLLTTSTGASAGTTAQTAAANALVYTVGAVDGSFWVGGSVNVTAFASGSITLQVAYTDASNVATTLNLNGHFTSGYGTSISGAGDFEGQLIQIRAKAGTTITVKTAGTFTSLTYDAYGTVMQVA
jgi:hypothetical protein